MEDFVGVMFGFMLGLVCAWLMYLISSSAEEPPRIGTTTQYITRCSHPFAKCECGEKFFLLYGDLMFAPTTCPNCNKARETMTIEHMYWEQQNWKPVQRKLDENKMKKPQTTVATA